MSINGYLDELERADRERERGEGCTGCERHLSQCVCPPRLPVRLRLVAAEQPSDRERREHALARVHRIPQNDARPGICGPEAA